jgi:hypothetical protein
MPNVVMLNCRASPGATCSPWTSLWTSQMLDKVENILKTNVPL